MKRIPAFLTALLLLCSSASCALAAKSKATPTPAPVEIPQEIVDPPESIRNLLDIALQDWKDTNGKDQGEKNKYTTWFNNYKWGKNAWCAGFVTWCMLEAGLPCTTYNDIKKLEDPEVPAPVFHMKESTPKKMFLGYQKYHRITLSPQKGFVILYGENSNKYVHVGLVYDVVPLGEGKYRLTTLEGAMKNTVRMFVFDYDMKAENTKKNISRVPEEERTEEESKIFTYDYHKSGKKIWYVNCFLMPWIPGDDAL